MGLKPEFITVTTREERGASMQQTALLLEWSNKTVIEREQVHSKDQIPLEWDAVMDASGR